MVTIRSINEIILNLRDFFKLVQPNMDTKPGTVARDLFIDAPASQLALLYDELSAVSNQQSLRLVVGSDLDKLAKNFGAVRKQATTSNGVALFTFSSINAPININKGATVIANNGFSFAVVNGVAVIPSAVNFYRSVASKFRDQLDFVGINDEFAVEVTVAATTAGSAGNIGSFSLNRTSIPGVSSVTNINPFTGGADQEQDAAFRNRVLASFSGSSVGTALGYLNVALGTTGVSDSYIVQPGDPLMTRDGTIVSIASDGTRTIVSEGSGGKVDVVVLGSILVQNTDSFIYQDKSNNNDPTNIKNDVVLGQIAADANKTINRKRIDDIKNGVLPAQPVDTLFSVTGSISGANFVEKSIDSLGRVSGNFELVKDTGVYGGSPFGFDKIHWISNKISGFNEDRVKGQFNGQDALTFTDIIQISQAQQNLSITNENSIVTSDRSIIQLLHTPATNVTRVFNVNTGERYIITNQNLDSTSSFNSTGRIQISGNTLPSPSDILQVDYNWIVNFDRYSDYDGLQGTHNPRSVTDSIDWGYASAVRNEKIKFEANGNFFQGTASQPINSVISADKFLEVDGYVTKVSSGIFVNRLAVVITNLVDNTQSVESIVLKNTNTELFATIQTDSNISTITSVVGIQIFYDTTIILPTDTVAQVGDKVTVIMNSVDIFSTASVSGSSNGNQITIPSSLVDTLATSINLRVTYISAVSDLFSSSVTSLPTSRVGNGFNLLNNNGFQNFSPVNLSRRENQTVQKNLSNQFFIELNLSAVEFSLAPEQIISVIRLSDGLEIWNSDNIGTVSVGTSGNYQLIFSGFNSPAIGDKVLAVYYSNDNNRFQPFSFSNEIIKARTDVLATDFFTGKFIVPINTFTAEVSGVNFTVFEPNTNIVLFTVTDGYLSNNISQPGTAILSSLTVNFSSLANLTAQKVKITGSAENNNGTYDILSYNLSTNTMIITNIMDHISNDQISIVRVLDGQEIWNYSGTIDIANNRLVFPATLNAASGDKLFVIFFRFKNLRKAPTRLVSTVVDQVVNNGVISVNGLSIASAQDVVFTATNNGLKLNLSEALRKALNLSSAAAIPSNIKIAKIIKAEKVVTESTTDDSVLEILATYDVFNTTIQNNLLYDDEMLSDPTLLNLDFVLPSTQNNTLDVQTHNLPKLGDKIRITFYYTTDNDTENLSYTRNGTLYTNKKFALINRAYVSSGFKSSQSSKLTFTSFTQPTLGARYKVFYDYTAPKQNERIVVVYNYNKLIGNVTFNIENTRPINADVLVRAAKLVELDLTMNVVISDSFISSTTTVLQNLRDKLTSTMTTTTLGQIVDQATLINVAQAVQGIARARILYFNKTGGIGQVLQVQAQNDEYFAPNAIIINTETR